MSNIGAIYGNTSQLSNTTGSATSNDSPVSFADMMNQQTVETAPAEKKDDALSAFLKYQKMTVAEKIRASYLAAHKLTEEELASLPLEDRIKIEKEIAEAIRKKVAGVDGDRNLPLDQAG